MANEGASEDPVLVAGGRVRRRPRTLVCRFSLNLPLDQRKRVSITFTHKRWAAAGAGVAERIGLQADNAQILNNRLQPVKMGFGAGGANRWRLF